MEVTAVVLKEDGLMALFIGLVCMNLDAYGFKGDKAELAFTLDMTFDELACTPIQGWDAKIKADLKEFMDENPGEFDKRH